MPDLEIVLTECLSLHAESAEALDTTRPELDPRIPDELREKVIRQRYKTQAASFGDDPELHRRHVEALNKGLRIVLRRLVPGAPKTPPPPLPTWDDTKKAWVVPGAPPAPKPRKPRAKPKPKPAQVELPLPEPPAAERDCPCITCGAQLSATEEATSQMLCDRCRQKGETA